MPNIKTAEEQTMVCETWMQSGLSKMEFCRQNNLNRSSFYKWLSQLTQLEPQDNKKPHASSKKLTLKDEPIKFLKVCHAVPPTPPIPSIPQRSDILKPGYLEVALTNGINFRISISQSEVNNLLQELLKWK